MMNAMESLTEQAAENGPRSSLTRRLRRAWRLAGRGLITCVFTLIGLVGVVVPWLLHKLPGFDPNRGASEWIERSRQPEASTKPWLHDPALTTRRKAGRGRRVVVVGALDYLRAAHTSASQRSVQPNHGARGNTYTISSDYRYRGAKTWCSDS